MGLRGRAGPAAARHPPPRRVAARRGRRVAGRRPALAGARWRSSAAGSTRSTRSTSAAASRSRRSASRRRIPAGSRASCRPCSTRSRRIGGRARLAIEPGRFLVARAGWLVARVLHVRERGGRQVVLDAGMTELIRPALYGARHDVVALTSLGQPIDRTARCPDRRRRRGRCRRPRPDLRVDRRARRARAAAAPARRPRRDPRRRRVRRVAVVDVQRPAAAAAGPARRRRRADAGAATRLAHEPSGRLDLVNGRERFRRAARGGPAPRRRRDGHAAVRRRRPPAGLPRRAGDDPAGARRLDPPSLPRGRRGHHRDRDVRREPGPPRGVRAGGRDRHASTAAAAQVAREARDVAGRDALVAGLDRPARRTDARPAPPRRSRDPRGVPRADRRPARGRRRPVHVRDVRRSAAPAARGRTRRGARPPTCRSSPS